MLNGDSSHPTEENQPAYPTDLLAAFQYQLEECFKLSPDFAFSNDPDPIGTRPAIYSNLCTNINFPGLDTPFRWHNSHLFEAYIGSLSLYTPKKSGTWDLDLPEDEDLAFAFDHHSLITSQLPESFDEPVQTADEIIKEIDLIMGHEEEVTFPSLGDELVDYNGMQPSVPFDVNLYSESDLESLSLNQLNALLEDLEAHVREYSAVLVHELAYREELDFEQEQKDLFIARLDETHKRLEHRCRRSSLPSVAHLDSTDYGASPVTEMYPDAFEQSGRDCDVEQENKTRGPFLSRAQSAAQAAVAAASSASTTIRRHWKRLSRGPDEMVDLEHNPYMHAHTGQVFNQPMEHLSRKSVPYTTQPAYNASGKCDEPWNPSRRTITIARLRKWAARKATDAMNSRTTSTFRALLRRTNSKLANPATSGATTLPGFRESRSAVTTPTETSQELPMIPTVLTHSASGHLVGNHAANTDDLEYKNLTTTIPYHRSANHEGPTAKQLELFNGLLLAILTNNPNLTAMLTDYILNVYAPADHRPSKLPI